MTELHTVFFSHKQTGSLLTVCLVLLSSPVSLFTSCIITYFKPGCFVYLSLPCFASLAQMDSATPHNERRLPGASEHLLYFLFFFTKSTVEDHRNIGKQKEFQVQQLRFVIRQSGLYLKVKLFVFMEASKRQALMEVLHRKKNNKRRDI